MRVLVLGASGNTGKFVVKQLLEHKIQTRVLIRRSASLSKEVMDHPMIEVVQNSISDMDEAMMDKMVEGCDVVVSCLGHNMTFKGMFGKPRHLVVNAVRNVCEAVKRQDDDGVKFILMSTTAYRDDSLGEKDSFAEKIVKAMVHVILPPHRDNMKAASYLFNVVGKDDPLIQWVAVRPDTLINQDDVTPYEISGSPVRSPIFNAGKTSRINVGHFIAALATDDTLWNDWVYKTPVMYNK